jgi:transposase
MPKAGPKRTQQYSEDFKTTAVQLSSLPGVRIKDVAESLDVHPFMLSRWRKEVREGRIVAKKKSLGVDPQLATELKRLKKVEKDFKQLQMEHELLKKAIRFCSDRDSKSSNT